MKYYYLTSNQTKIETTKEMYDSQVQYDIELELQLDQGRTEDFDFSDFALEHTYAAPKDAESTIVYVDYTVY